MSGEDANKIIELLKEENAKLKAELERHSALIVYLKEVRDEIRNGKASNGMFEVLDAFGTFTANIHESMLV